MVLGGILVEVWFLPGENSNMVVSGNAPVGSFLVPTSILGSYHSSGRIPRDRHRSIEWGGGLGVGGSHYNLRVTGELGAARKLPYLFLKWYGVDEGSRPSSHP